LTSIRPPITGKLIAIDPLQLVVPVAGAGGVIDQRQRLAGFVDAEAGRHQRLLDPPIVIKKHVHRYQETPVNSRRRRRHYCTISLTRRVTGISRHAERWAPLDWGETHAPTNGRTCGCSHLRSDPRVRQHNGQRRVDDDHPIDDSAASC
jgi:hypothetical protein